jgi:tetratricopeptide (TPR) repeat protein
LPSGRLFILDKRQRRLSRVTSNRAVLQEALKIDPNHADAYHNRGYAYYHLRDCDKAIADLTQALEIDPNR